MNIGVPKERRPFEYRVGLTPAAVEELVAAGHTCDVEHNAGLGSGFSDLDYQKAGAHIVYSPHEVFGRADLLLKVARPVQEELEWLRPGTIFAGLLHLASARQDKVETLLRNNITAIAYEQIQLGDGSLPVLRSMSQICGKMAAQIASGLLMNNFGGKGILMGGVAGVPPAEIAIIGGGVVGSYAAQAFLGMGAHVAVLDNNLQALQNIHEKHPHVATMISNPRNLNRICGYADVIVGAVLVSGERTPVVITEEMVRTMKPRSIVMDISIDQGGCVETSRPTTHEHPTFVKDSVVHYCVPNIPGVVARTATYAFTNAALRYISEIASRGIESAISEDPALERAVNTHRGERVHLSTLSVEEMVD
jgi:alanine dehydrogenase